MLRLFAILFGIAFIFAGVAGMMPSFTPNNMLFGFFQVDLMHNLAHIASGVIAIMASTSYRLTRLYFILIGLIYAAVAIFGFVRGGDLSMVGMHMNMPDNLLHTGIAIIALLVGFKAKKRA